MREILSQIHLTRVIVFSCVTMYFSGGKRVNGPLKTIISFQVFMCFYVVLLLQYKVIEIHLGIFQLLELCF